MSIRNNLISINEGRAVRSESASIEARPRRDIERNDVFWPVENDTVWPVEYGTASYARARELRARALRELVKSLGRRIVAGARRSALRAASFLVSIGEAAAARRTYEVLSRLSDRQLADIGLTRHDIPAFAYRNFRIAQADATHSASSPAGLVERDIRKAA